MSESSPVRVFPSERGRLGGFDSAPLLVYGQGAAKIGELVAAYSTLSTISIQGLANLSGVLRHVRRAVGLYATSRTGFSGEAGEALSLFRREHPARAALLYGALDYNVERAARKAVELGADGVVMPGIELDEWLEYAFNILREAASGAAPPATVAEHRARIERWAPRSPFWKLQDARASGVF